MNTYADSLDTDILTFLERHQNKDLLRFVTVGSVDDGKSTLIGRLLHDTHGVYEDQLDDARRSAKGDDEIDFALLTDGLRAEREQGITIDVAYRYFTTPRRKFIIADTPGHIQYTRNMATGASTADVAIILIDARLGVLQQSRRHAYIASLIGIDHLVVSINKMDLVDYGEARYEEIKADFAAVAAQMKFKDVTFFPISALKGDNIVERSERTPWYDGPTLLEFLETVDVGSDAHSRPFRYPVQYVLRPNLNYRGFAGQIVSGVIKKGDTIKVIPSNKTSTVAAIDTFHGELEVAHAPMSVTLRLSDEIDISRGDMLVLPDAPPTSSRRFRANLVWMHEAPLSTEKTYIIKHTTRYLRVQLDTVEWRLDLADDLDHETANELVLNDIGSVLVTCDRPVHFDPYDTDRNTGAFIVIDAMTNTTVAAGMIVEAVAEARAPALEVITLRERALRLGHNALLLVVKDPQPQGIGALERQLFDGGLLTARLDDVAPKHLLEVARPVLEAGLVALALAPDAATLDLLTSHPEVAPRLLVIDGDKLARDLEGVASAVVARATGK